jgi:hypothetical protein
LETHYYIATEAIQKQKKEDLNEAIELIARDVDRVADLVKREAENSDRPEYRKALLDTARALNLKELPKLKETSQEVLNDISKNKKFLEHELTLRNLVSNIESHIKQGCSQNTHIPPPIPSPISLPTNAQMKNQLADIMTFAQKGDATGIDLSLITFDASLTALLDQTSGGSMTTGNEDAQKVLELIDILYTSKSNVDSIAQKLVTDCKNARLQKFLHTSLLDIDEKIGDLVSLKSRIQISDLISGIYQTRSSRAIETHLGSFYDSITAAKPDHVRTSCQQKLNGSIEQLKSGLQFISVNSDGYKVVQTRQRDIDLLSESLISCGNSLARNTSDILCQKRFGDVVHEWENLVTYFESIYENTLKNVALNELVSAISIINLF